MKILEAGLMIRWKNKWFSDANRCTGLETAGTQSKITLAEAQGAFYLFGIGLLVALIAIVLERAVYSIYVKQCGGLCPETACPRWPKSSGCATISTISTLVSQTNVSRSRSRSRSRRNADRGRSTRDRLGCVNQGFSYNQDMVVFKHENCTALSYTSTDSNGPAKKKSHSIGGTVAIDFVPHATRIKLRHSMSVRNGDLNSSVKPIRNAKSLRRRPSPNSMKLQPITDQPDVETGETTHYTSSDS